MFQEGRAKAEAPGPIHDMLAAKCPGHPQARVDLGPSQGGGLGLLVILTTAVVVLWPLLRHAAFLVPLRRAWALLRRIRGGSVADLRGAGWMPGACMCRWRPTRLWAYAPPCSHYFSVALKSVTLLGQRRSLSPRNAIRTFSDTLVNIA